MKLLLISALSLIITGGCAMIDRRDRAYEERVILWLDGTANFERLGTEEGIIRVFDKAGDIGVTDLVLCVKRSNGYVLFESAHAPQLKEWNGFRRAEDFDFVNTAIDHAHKRDMNLYLSLNIFSEGDKISEIGTMYTRKHTKEWQTILYTPEGLIPITEHEPGYAAFTNPALPEVQQYQLQILEEVAEKFQPDGIILDRCRYNNIESDFSDFSREQFEEYLVKTRNKTVPIIKNWPEDIFIWIQDNDEYIYEPGPYFKEWLEWRAWIIKEFVKDARQVIKEANPRLEVANYVGAWYPLYYELGVNWAAREYDPSQDYEWASSLYFTTLKSRANCNYVGRLISKVSIM